MEFYGRSFYFAGNTFQQSELQPEELMEEVTVAPGITLPKVLAAYWPEISGFKQTFIRIDPEPDTKLSLQEVNSDIIPACRKI